MTMHTPGPWHAEYDSDLAQWVLSMGPSVGDTCHQTAHRTVLYAGVYPDDCEQFAEVTANVRLMEASPALFDLLERILIAHEQSDITPAEKTKLAPGLAALVRAHIDNLKGGGR